MKSECSATLIEGRGLGKVGRGSPFCSASHAPPCAKGEAEEEWLTAIEVRAGQRMGGVAAGKERCAGVGAWVACGCVRWAQYSVWLRGLSESFLVSVVRRVPW